MSIVNKFVPAVDAISVIILVCVSHSEDEPKPPAGVNALAAESAAEEKSRPAAEAKSSSSREYFRVNLIDRAKVVEWLRANGYANYVIEVEPRPNKTLVMQLLKRGIDIPGCTLEPSTRGKKDNED